MTKKAKQTPREPNEAEKLKEINTTLAKYHGQLVMLETHLNKLRVVKIDNGWPAEVLGSQDTFLLTSQSGMIICERNDSTDGFSCRQERSTGLDFPCRTLDPVMKRPIQRLNQVNVGRGILGTEAICEWFMADYLSCPTSNAMEALKFILEIFGIKDVTLSDERRKEG